MVAHPCSDDSQVPLLLSFMPMCDSSAACPRSCGQSLHRGPAVHSALYGGAPGAFPRGTLRSAAPTGASEVSRFSCRKFLGVHWGLRLRRTAPELALSFRRMLPSAQVQKRRHPDWGFSEINYPAHLSPVYASCRLSRGATQNSGPSGSLFLTRKASSSSASYRFIPAHGLSPSSCRTCSAQSGRRRGCSRRPPTPLGRAVRHPAVHETDGKRRWVSNNETSPMRSNQDWGKA